MVDNIFTLKILVDKRIQRDSETCMVFIDLEKVSDSVLILQLWKAVSSIRINRVIVQPTKNLYDNKCA